MKINIKILKKFFYRFRNNSYFYFLMNIVKSSILCYDEKISL